MRTHFLLLVCLACGAIGCSDANPPAGGAIPPPNSAASSPSGGPPAPVPPAPVPPAAASMPPAAGGPPAPVPAAATPGATQEKASAALTKRGAAGQQIGKGIISTPTGTFLRIADRPMFLNIQHAMDLYKGEHGALPKTHDDFMRDIIEANNIKLPELPDDSHYIYLPDKEELMIERRPL